MINVEDHAEKLSDDKGNNNSRSNLGNENKCDYICFVSETSTCCVLHTSKYISIVLVLFYQTHIA